MTQQHWLVTAEWDDGEKTVKRQDSVRELKHYLDREVFCQKHGCPLPVDVHIRVL